MDICGEKTEPYLAMVACLGLNESHGVYGLGFRA